MRTARRVALAWLALAPAACTSGGIVGDWTCTEFAGDSYPMVGEHTYTDNGDSVRVEWAYTMQLRVFDDMTGFTLTDDSDTRFVNGVLSSEDVYGRGDFFVVEPEWGPAFTLTVPGTGDFATCTVNGDLLRCRHRSVNSASRYRSSYVRAGGS